MIFMTMGIFIELTQMPAAQAICGGQKKNLTKKRNVITVIITNPSNLENIFIVCL